MTVVTMLQAKSRSRDIEELRSQLNVFTRVATALRNAKEARNLGQLTAVEQEIDALRNALGYAQGGFAA
jgi:hypothetical protein